MILLILAHLRCQGIHNLVVSVHHCLCQSILQGITSFTFRTTNMAEQGNSFEIANSALKVLVGSQKIGTLR